MKILFVACYTNNSHFIDYTKKTLEQNLIDCSYDYICLNDATDRKNGDEDYLKMADILSGENDCYERILDKTQKNNFIHIKIPQNIHIKNRPNHGGPRHIENLNWFNQNIDFLYPKYTEYDYICHIDSDAFFVKPIDLRQELKNYDLAGPFIYIRNGYYIHTGLFFINLKTVSNMKEINWSNTMGTDTGSDIFNFIKNNPQYKIKKLGHYDGYSSNNWTENGDTIIKLNIDDVDDENYKLIDCWFDKKVLHFRAGSCFGVGTLLHRNKYRLRLYAKKWESFINCFKMDKNITVIGIGRLGLGFALLIEKAGYSVCGVDIFPKYVETINRKKYRTKEPKYEDLLQNSNNFHATTNLEEGLNHSDIIFIVVQTPNGGGDKFYDHTILSNLLMKINSYKIKNKHFIIGSTIMPKYIDEVGEFLVSDCENCTVSYNPEFIAQGEIIKGFLYPDIILIGTKTKELGDKLREIYDSFILSTPKYCILRPIEAEIAKIAINGFITTKVSFANMISDVCDKAGANKHKVLAAVGGDSRIGNKYFRPGHSFGGPCFPRDTKALKQFVDKVQINSDLLTATAKYNEEHINFQVYEMLMEDKITYTIENICYKENCKIPIIEESAKLKIAKKLVEAGKSVIIKDEKHMIDEVKKVYGNLFNYQIVY